MPNATSVWDFSDGQILTAAKLDDVNCGIHVFADSTARTNAYGGTNERTLVEGEFSYLADTNQTQYYNGSSWITLGGKIGQVVSTTKTDTFSTTSTTWTDITGFSLTITPIATTSKVFIIATFLGDSNGLDIGMLRLVRDSTAIAVGDAAGSRVQVSAIGNTFAANFPMQGATSFLDSPSTTSSTTYKMQAQIISNTFYLNRSGTDTNNAVFPRGVSTITAFEVLA